MKKNFKGTNPALEFISTDAQEEPQETKQTPATKKEAPEGYKINPEYIEVKSKRVQLVFQPSIYNRAKAAADKAGISLNEYLHRLIDENTERED